jgi:hypothetical protein
VVTPKPADVRIEITRHGRYKDWVVGYSPGGVIPKQFYARVQRSGWPTVTAYLLVDRHSRVQCDRLIFERASTESTGLLARDIGAVRVGDLLQWVVAEAVGNFELQPGRGWIQGKPGTGSSESRSKAAGRFLRDAVGRPPTPIEKRQRVLSLWKQAEDEEWANAAARIGREVKLSRSKVYEIRNEQRRKEGRSGGTR